MSCDSPLELRVSILIFPKKMVSEIKRPLLWKISDPPLRYMYIVIQCGLSSIVEYGATIYVVECVAFSVLVNKCVRPSCTLGGSTYPKKTGTHRIKYHVCSMRLNFVVSQYLVCTLRDSHYFI
jgi:hypothetical protein